MTWPHVFSRAWRRLHAFASSSDWFHCAVYVWCDWSDYLLWFWFYNTQMKTARLCYLQYSLDRLVWISLTSIGRSWRPQLSQPCWNEHRCIYQTYWSYHFELFWHSQRLKNTNNWCQKYISESYLKCIQLFREILSNWKASKRTRQCRKAWWVVVVSLLHRQVHEVSAR